MRWHDVLNAGRLQVYKEIAVWMMASGLGWKLINVTAQLQSGSLSAGQAAQASPKQG
jgi:hypothetical protein